MIDFPYQAYGPRFLSREWLNETFPNAWVASDEVAFNPTTKLLLMSYYFKNESDAAWFKLKFENVNSK